MNKLILLCILTIGLVQADLPVHCMKHQITGKWKMEVSQTKLKGMGAVPCGHHVPDSQQSSYQAGFDDFKAADTFEVNLSNDYSVQDKDRKTSGQWTMVYDEGFEVEHNGVKYFAFSKYAPNGSDYKSYCGETLIGWYNNLKTGEKGCYRAKKTDGDNEATDSYQLISVVQPEFIQKSTRHGDRVKLHKNFDNHKEAVDKLNSIPKTWKAKAYDHFEGMSMMELNKMAGRRKHFQGKSIKKASFTQIKSGDVSGLPKQFSLEQYLDPPRQQKQCGSCYAISTMEMLSARLKMKGEQVTLSPQYSVDCNYFNQGCDGGYPFLVEKFASEQYLVTEEQYPYKGDVGTCKKIDFSQSSKVYGAKNYKYIGGGYGLSNERDIMMELYTNGPVIMNFEPSYDFMYYESGIYHSVAEHDWSTQDRPEWEKVDHSVLCYGWGEEDGVKFWLLQNSWGSQWGENGSFRMKRGVDESAIESMAEAADPVIYSRSNSEFIELKKEQNLRKQ
ncbi:unnamed protein product [Paramecium octaurelia]|uniref:Dipeptidyl peptidase 1 n=1 Tax=Paramecium octaurelia TaxID=43137 RepID=A0A8S1SAF8_PAROT|nr:unnamed protein product [Paramecium octaurelia]